jgi:AAA domain/DnaB-like helicase N terminal domain
MRRALEDSSKLQLQAPGSKTNGLNSEWPLRALDAALLDPLAWKKVRSLALDDFFDPSHRSIFIGMQTLEARSQEISLANLLDVVERDALLRFTSAQSDLYPRTRPQDADTYIEKVTRETAVRISLHEIDRIHESASNGGGISENDLISLGEFGRKIRNTRRLVVHELDEFLSTEFADADPLVRLDGSNVAVFSAASINQIFAWRGTGKTFIALALGVAMAQGREFLRWRPMRKIKVLYVEGECRNSQTQRRLKALAKGPTDPRYFRLITFFSQVDGITSLSTPQGRQALESEVGDAEVLFLDSVATLTAFPTNDEEGWIDFLQWLNHLRQRGLCVIVLHHAGKSGMQRGHSRSEDLLDVSIKLTRDPNEECDWLKCTLAYDKFRDDPKGIRSLVVEYREGEWLHEALEVEKLQALSQFLTERPQASIRTIARALPELGGRSSVQRLKQKLDEKES